MTVVSQWGARAAELYSEAYARRYRAEDDVIQRGELVSRFEAWLRGIRDRFPRPIDVLDLGCGTGRYFHALTGVGRLVGIDVSAPMLDRARHPVGDPTLGPTSLTLIEADFLHYDFQPGEFDLAYSIGVLAEHSPLDTRLAARVSRWLKPGGRFAFTAVHPLSFSVPRTLRRRLGERLLPWSRGVFRRALRSRLMSHGLYADEERVREVLGATDLMVESIEPFESDVHLHLLTVSLKRS